MTAAKCHRLPQVPSLAESTKTPAMTLFARSDCEHNFHYCNFQVQHSSYILGFVCCDCGSEENPQQSSVSTVVFKYTTKSAVCIAGIDFKQVAC